MREALTIAADKRSEQQKSELTAYYRTIAPVLVPHLRNRPFTMKRSP